MRPPVALLVYRPDAPRHAVFYPFAVFSPEWQAIRFAQERGTPVRFMDLPLRLQLAEGRPSDSSEARHPDEPAGPLDPATTGSPPPHAEPTLDPLAALAVAAGYDDHELWWEHQVERRRDPE